MPADASLCYVHCPDRAGGHRMAYWQWGQADAPHVVVCVHGLTRQGRDFDALAGHLIAAASTPLRVVCPDVVGRGQSDWMPQAADYQLGTYAADMLALLAALQPQTLDWVGTSMGGLIGMALAGQPQLPLPVRIRRLVLNDVGPELTWEGLVRIGTYVGHHMDYPSLEDAAAALRAIAVGFGPHTDAEWLDLTRPMLKPGAQGGVRLHYDPAIGEAVRAVTPESAQQGQAALWALYDNITAQTLLLRGQSSDLLTSTTALDMTRRGPCARLVEFAGVGHAPTLVAPDQRACVAEFLLS